MDRQSIQRILKKCIEFGFYALIFFLPISKALVESFAGFIVFFFIINKIFFWDFSGFKREARIFWLILAVFVLSALSLVNSGPLLAKGFRTLSCKWAEYLLLFIAAVDCFQDKKKIIRFFYVMFLSASLVGLSALTQKFLGLEFLRHRPMVGVAVTGPFENPNSLSGYLVLCLPVMFSVFYGSWKVFKRGILIFISCAILITALLLTFSRAGWIGFFVAAVMTLFLSKKRSLPLMTIGIFSASLFFAPFSQRFLQCLRPEGDGQRLTIWKGAIAMIREDPWLGKGLGTFMDHFAQYVPGMGVHYAHNSYLQMWAEAGIFTLIAFVSLAGLVVWRGARIVLKNGQGDLVFLLTGLVAGITGFLTTAFFDNELYSLQLSVLFWVVLGMTVSLERVVLDKT